MKTSSSEDMNISVYGSGGGYGTSGYGKSYENTGTDQFLDSINSIISGTLYLFENTYKELGFPTSLDEGTWDLINTGEDVVDLC